MTGRRLVTAMVCGLAVVLMAGATVLAQAPAPKDLVGIWEGGAQTPNGEVTLKMEVTLKDDKLAATIESSMGPMPVRSFALEGDQLKAEIEVMGSPATLAAKVQGKRMDGTWTFGADSGPFVLAKAVTAEDVKK